jgi:hypothetical protein
LDDPLKQIAVGDEMLAVAFLHMLQVAAQEPPRRFAPPPS